MVIKLKNYPTIDVYKLYKIAISNQLNIHKIARHHQKYGNEKLK